MKTKLLIIYQIFAFIAATLFLSLFSGSKISFEVIPYILPVLGAIGLTIILVSVAFVTPRVLYRKNLLRISGLIVGVLFVSSLISRIIEIVNGNFSILATFLTFIYLILLIIIIKTLKSLYELVEKTFKS